MENVAGDRSTQAKYEVHNIKQMKMLLMNTQYTQSGFAKKINILRVISLLDSHILVRKQTKIHLHCHADNDENRTKIVNSTNRKIETSDIRKLHCNEIFSTKVRTYRVCMHTEQLVKAMFSIIYIVISNGYILNHIYTEFKSRNTNEFANVLCRFPIAELTLQLCKWRKTQKKYSIYLLQCRKEEK